MYKKLNALYDKALQECRNLAPAKVILKYDLDENELLVLRWLYKKQLPLETIEDEFEYTIGKTGFKRIWQSLKNKGLIYAVEETVYDDNWDETGEVNYIGDFGTEIKV